MALPEVYLNKNEDRRLLAGHLWIFSNEIDTKRSPLSSFEIGSLVRIKNQRNVTLGIGTLNPHTLLAIRLLTRDPNQIIDQKFFSQRLEKALTLRERCFSQPYYRLIFGESDGLPGVVLDRFNDIFVLQITTAGMEKLKTPLIDAIVKRLNPQGILLRNDLPMRELEGLPLSNEVIYGKVPELVSLQENHCQFLAPVMQGQKTGWFYDHRSNRALLKNYVDNKRVLDIFCYTGAWGIQAAKFGAREVIGLDASEFALTIAKQNAQLNHVDDKISFLMDDAFKALEKLAAHKEKFDVIILDPPAFIKRRKDIASGSIGYRKINELALRLLNPQGILFTASCSSHLKREQLVDIVRQAGLRTQRNLSIIAQLQQAPDHPIHPAIFETEYLKGLAVFAD